MSEIMLDAKDRKQLLDFLESYLQNIDNNDLEDIRLRIERKIGLLQSVDHLPSFIPEMISKIKDLVRLVDHKIGTEEDINKASAALSYFLWSEDKIHDLTPVVGYLDDAFVISVVFEEVKPSIVKARKLLNIKE